MTLMTKSLGQPTRVKGTLMRKRSKRKPTSDPNDAPCDEKDGAGRSGKESPEEDGEGHENDGVDVEEETDLAVLVYARLLLLQRAHLGVRQLVLLASHLLYAADPLAHLLVPRQTVVVCTHRQRTESYTQAAYRVVHISTNNRANSYIQTHSRTDSLTLRHRQSSTQPHTDANSRTTKPHTQLVVYTDTYIHSQLYAQPRTDTVSRTHT